MKLIVIYLAVYCVDCKKKFGLFEYRTEATTGIKGKICSKCNEKRYLKKANEEKKEELDKQKKIIFKQSEKRVC